jgi:hypothetical protein
MMMIPAMLPRAAHSHDSRGRPVSEMDGSAGIADRTAMQKLVSAEEATGGEHWTFRLCGRAERSASKMRGWAGCLCVVPRLAGNEAGRAAVGVGGLQEDPSGARKPRSVRVREKKSS